MRPASRTAITYSPASHRSRGIGCVPWCPIRIGRLPWRVDRLLHALGRQCSVPDLPSFVAAGMALLNDMHAAVIVAAVPDAENSGVESDA